MTVSALVMWVRGFLKCRLSLRSACPCGQLLANAGRKNDITTARELLQQPAPDVQSNPKNTLTPNAALQPTTTGRAPSV